MKKLVRQGQLVTPHHLGIDHALAHGTDQGDLAAVTGYVSATAAAGATSPHQREDTTVTGGKTFIKTCFLCCSCTPTLNIKKI